MPYPSSDMSPWLCSTTRSALQTPISTANSHCRSQREASTASLPSTFTMSLFRLFVLSFLLVHGAQTFSPAAIPFVVRTPYLNAWQIPSAESTNNFPFFWNNTVREHFTFELYVLTSQHRRTSAGYATFGSTTRHIRFGVTRVLMQSQRIELLKQAYYPRPSLLRHAQYKS